MNSGTPHEPTTVESIAADTGLTEEEVTLALDRLEELGLITKRVIDGIEVYSLSVNGKILL